MATTVCFKSEELNYSAWASANNTVYASARPSSKILVLPFSDYVTFVIFPCVIKWRHDDDTMVKKLSNIYKIFRSVLCTTCYICTFLINEYRRENGHQKTNRYEMNKSLKVKIKTLLIYKTDLYGTSHMNFINFLSQRTLHKCWHCSQRTMKQDFKRIDYCFFLSRKMRISCLL